MFKPLMHTSQEMRDLADKYVEAIHTDRRNGHGRTVCKNGYPALQIMLNMRLGSTGIETADALDAAVARRRAL